ncbi:MAG: carbohydrate ABC transporter substrate-binding protein [bacterium]|nr:carbohydrate ABC transporter substrate-binding protein [bacterium]
MRRMKYMICMLILLSLTIVPLWAGADEPVTIRILSYHHTGAHDYPIYKDYMDQFLKDHPNVTIEHEGLESADARTKLAVEMAAGNPPDISFMVLGLGREYSSKGLLLDLWPYMEKDPEWKNTYNESALQGSLWDGKLFIAPSQGHMGGMFYNPDVLKEVGFDGPAKTWDELIAQATALKAVGKTALLTGGKNFRYAWLISQIMVRTCGVDTISELYGGSQKTAWDDPANGFIEALKRIDELAKAGGFPKDVNGLDRNTSYLLFGDGQSAYYYEGTWLINTFKANVSEEFRDSLQWAPFPSIEGTKGEQDGGVGGPLLGWGVSSKLEGRKKELAIEYVRGVEGQAIATRHLKENNQPTGTKPLDEAWENIHPLLNTIVSYYGSISKAAYPTDVAAPSPVDNAIKKIAVPAIIDGTMTPEEAAKEVNLRAIEYWKAQ